MGSTAVSTADLEFQKEYNAGVNGEAMVDHLLTLVAHQHTYIHTYIHAMSPLLLTCAVVKPRVHACGRDGPTAHTCNSS